jgi:2-polyprenyl-3-methyl-5-hydroxy-6-metoxy-1,4-benzoquinol methylase
MNTTLYSSELPSPLVYPLTDNGRLVRMLSEVTGRAPEATRQILLREETHLMSQANEEFYRCKLPPGVWCDELVEYYAQTDGFLFSGVVWNRNPNKLAMRDWIGRYLRREGLQGQRILTFGDGPGFDSLYLAQCGHQVTYFEVSAPLIRFASEVFRLSDVAVQIVQQESDIEQNAYDVVLCLDVLEHLPDPSALVEKLTAMLRPGGRLIVNAPFFFVSPQMPTHLRSNLRYSGSLRLFAEHGLRPLDGRPFGAPLVLGRPGPEAPRAASLARRLGLRLTMLPMLFSRLCPAPLSWIAVSMWKGDPRWQKELAAPLAVPER